MSRDVAIYLSASDAVDFQAMESSLSSQKYPTGLALDGELRQMQEFLIALFTQRGSSQFRPSYGCNFFDDLVSRRLQTAQDVNASFALAVDEILSQLAETTIRGARMDQIIIYEDTIVLRITLDFADGTSRSSEVPLELSNPA